MENKNKEGSNYSKYEIESKISERDMARQAFNKANEYMNYCENKLKEVLQRLQDKWKDDSELNMLFQSNLESLSQVYSERINSQDEINYLFKKDIEKLEEEKAIIELENEDNYEDNSDEDNKE
mgnify:CR=1 FL=1